MVRDSIGVMKLANNAKAIFPTDCRACAVRESTVCGAVSMDELEKLQAFKSDERAIRAGTDFLSQGEPDGEFFTLLDGWALLYELLEDGRRQILDFALPGAVIGFQPASGMPMSYSAQALGDIRVCAFPRSRLPDFVRAHPETGLRMACLAARDHHLAYNHLSNVGRRTARERIANLLIELYYRVRLESPVAGGDEIPLPLTQEHIGDALGLTSVHVNRMLRALREDEVLSLSGGTLRVLDPDRLAQEAGFDAEVTFARA